MLLARQGKVGLFLPIQQKKTRPDTKKLLRREVPMIWLRGKDLNLRPSGYEPDELPDCSIPRYQARHSDDANHYIAVSIICQYISLNFFFR